LYDVPPEMSSGGVKKEFTCFLFNDMLLIAKRKRVRKTLVYVDRIDLNAAQGTLQDIPDNYRESFCVLSPHPFPLFIGSLHVFEDHSKERDRI